MERLRTVGMLTLLVVASIATNKGATACDSPPGAPCSEDAGEFIVELLPISGDSGVQLEEATSFNSKGWTALIRSFATDPLVDELCSPLAQEHMSDDDKKDIKNLCRLMKKEAEGSKNSNEGDVSSQMAHQRQETETSSSNRITGGYQEEFNTTTTPKAMILIIAAVAVGCIIITACLTCAFGKLDSTIDSPYHMTYENARVEAHIESKGG